MTRSLSSDFIESLMAERTSEIYHTLITITGAGISTKRYTDNYEDVSSGGNTYTAAAFEVALPDDVEEQVPDVNIVVDNVDRALITDIRSVTGVPEVEIKNVLQSAPNVVEIGPLNFKVRSVNYDKHRISGSLQYQDILNETYPDKKYTPQLFPGLFP